MIKKRKFFFRKMFIVTEYAALTSQCITTTVNNESRNRKLMTQQNMRLGHLVEDPCAIKDLNCKFIAK